MLLLFLKMSNIQDGVRDSSSTIKQGDFDCDVILCFATNFKLCNSYTMGCPPIRGDNPRALASGLSYVQVDKHGITILYHLHQCRPWTSQDISC